MTREHPIVVISGSRGFTDLDFIIRLVDRLIKLGAFIRYGDAPNGVDRMVAEYVSFKADDVYQYEEFPAEWERYGRRAGHLRNGWMLTGPPQADMAICVFAPGERTPGTSNTLAQAKKLGIAYRVYQTETRLIERSER